MKLTYVMWRSCFETWVPLSSPGMKPSSEEAEKASSPLEGNAVTLYRSGAARCNNLSVDRPDFPLETEEIIRNERLLPDIATSSSLQDMIKEPRLAWCCYLRYYLSAIANCYGDQVMDHVKTNLAAGVSPWKLIYEDPFILQLGLPVDQLMKELSRTGGEYKLTRDDKEVTRRIACPPNTFEELVTGTSNVLCLGDSWWNFKKENGKSHNGQSDLRWYCKTEKVFIYQNSGEGA